MYWKYVWFFRWQLMWTIKPRSQVKSSINSAWLLKSEILTTHRAKTLKLYYWTTAIWRVLRHQSVLWMRHRLMSQSHKHSRIRTWCPVSNNPKCSNQFNNNLKCSNPKCNNQCSNSQCISQVLQSTKWVDNQCLMCLHNNINLNHTCLTMAQSQILTKCHRMASQCKTHQSTLQSLCHKTKHNNNNLQPVVKSTISKLVSTP